MVSHYDFIVLHGRQRGLTTTVFSIATQAEHIFLRALFCHACLVLSRRLSSVALCAVCCSWSVGGFVSPRRK